MRNRTGIEFFLRGARGQQYGLPFEVAAYSQHFANRGDDGVLSGEASRAGHAASQIAFIGIDDVNAATAQTLQIFLSGRMIPHVDVHRRRDDHRRGGGQIQRAEKIVADTSAEFREDVRGGWRNQQQIGALRHGDMFDCTFEIGFAAGFSEKSGDHFFSGERGKGERRDEFARRASHDHFNRESLPVCRRRTSSAAL